MMSDVKNLFIEHEEAKRYNLYRPIYHHLLAQKLCDFFGHTIPKVLDVACGTGHSTKALAKMSDQIIGCDVSEAMLREAKDKSQLQFIRANAEELPFPNAEFDYVNISMAYQWLNQSKFLQEVMRVLNSNGVLGIDNYGFTGKMIGHDDFAEKYKQFDRQHMKQAARNKNYPDEIDLKKAGFKLLQELKYDHEVLMNHQQFTNYLKTRSNFLELQPDQRTFVENHLSEYYKTSFQNDSKTLVFQGKVMLLNKSVP